MNLQVYKVVLLVLFSPTFPDMNLLVYKVVLLVLFSPTFPDMNLQVYKVVHFGPLQYHLS